MKIGILTYHRTINYGSELQALSVYELLKDEFKEAEIEIIDYNPIHGPLKEMLVALYPKNISWIIKGMQYFLQFHNFIENKMPISKKRIFTNNYEKATRFMEKQNYDIIFVGSDTVFEYKKGLESFAPKLPNIFWLNPKLKCKKIGISVSADKTKLEYFSEEDKSWAKSCIESFDYIGIRDTFTKDVLTDFLGITDDTKMIDLPDPTFYLTIPNTNAKDRLEKLGIDFSKPTLGIHIGDDNLSKIVVSYYKRKGYQIIAPRYNKYADYNLAPYINPYEWAEVYKYFNFTITDRFHGTIFCIKNKASFLSIDFVKDYGEEKTKKDILLNIFSLTQRLYRYNEKTFNENSFYSLLEKTDVPLDTNSIDKNLDIQKQILKKFVNTVREKI